MTTDGSNTLSRADLLTLGNRAQLEALQFRPLAADTAPELIDLGTDEARMPLSAAYPMAAARPDSGMPVTRSASAGCS